MVAHLNEFNGKWGTIPFSEYFEFLSTNTYSRDQLSNSGEIGNIHYGDVLIKYGCILSENDYIPRLKDASKIAIKHYLKMNDVIIADTAEDEAVGKAVQVGNIVMPLVGGLHTMACRPNYPTAHGFLGYYMNSKSYHEQMMPYVTGIKVSSISKKSINKTELHIPTDVAEQEAIVSILSSFDEHIDNLTELIEKKKAICDGALEDLVSGKTRLDGFDGGWEEGTIGSILTILHGKNQRSVESFSGKYPILGTGGIMGRATDFLCNWECVLIGRKGTIDNPLYMNEPFWTIDTLYYSKPKINQCAKFQYYLFLTISWVDYAESSGRPSLAKRVIEGVSIRIPCLSEQEAIASTLTAMDEEIEAIEVEKAKMAEIREGAMDALLTGRVCLKV